jgi:hypothetical protein
MVEEAEIYKTILKAHADSGEILFLEEASLNLTIDIIGRSSHVSHSIIFV